STLTQPVMDEAISPARLLPRDLTNGSAQGILRLAHRTVTDAGAREPREPKRAPLGDVICGSQLPDDLAPRPGRHNLFPRTSFSAWRLRAWSATIRFSWRFSSSSCLSRFASETSMPPYFRFQAYRVSRLMPSRRHSSRTFAPASASLTAATFCSSVNLALAHDSSAFGAPESDYKWIRFRGSAQLQCIYRHIPGCPFTLHVGSAIHTLPRPRVRLEDVLVDDLALLLVHLRRVRARKLVEDVLDRDQDGRARLLTLPPVEDQFLALERLEQLAGDGLDLLDLSVGQLRAGLHEQVEDGELLLGQILGDSPLLLL